LHTSKQTIHTRTDVVTGHTINEVHKTGKEGTTGHISPDVTRGEAILIRTLPLLRKRRIHT
jgi:hypothetical protein